MSNQTAICLDKCPCNIVLLFLTLEGVSVDLRISIIKPRHANWLINVLSKLKEQRKTVQRGFEKSGIASCFNLVLIHYKHFIIIVILCVNMNSISFEMLNLFPANRQEHANSLNIFPAKLKYYTVLHHGFCHVGYSMKADSSCVRVTERSYMR